MWNSCAYCKKLIDINKTFCSDNCKIKILLYGNYYSKFIAYLEIKDEDEILCLGDRLVSPKGETIKEEFSYMGSRKGNVFIEGISIFRPILICSLLKEDRGTIYDLRDFDLSKKDGTKY